MNRILVTGGAGFLGSNLCRRLLEDSGNEVTALDNLYTGRIENIADLLQNERFHFVQADVMDPIEMEVDQIYNAACPASPPAYQKNPVNTTKTSVLGILNMLELAKKNNAKILQFSTSEVYGDPAVHPQSEEYWGNVNPNGLRSCYDEGKRCAESICMDYLRQYGTRVKIIRIFNTYGPYMDPADGRVISNFIIAALKNEDIPVYGTGEQTRSFCYVDDLIEGIVRMMNDTPEDFAGPVNLGNPGEFTMLELAERVIRLTGSASKLQYLDLPADDPTRRRPNIERAAKHLKWQPQICLEEGLKRTIEYYKSRI